MHWFTAVVVYVMVWWTVLFAVLPFGAEPQEQADSATGWRGVPAQPRLVRKLLATTLISLIVWGAIMLVIQSPYLSFRAG